MEFRRLKVHVVLIIFAVVLVLGLLGQYFLHQKQVLEPMMAQVAGVDGVQEATLSRRKQKTVVSVFLDDDAKSANNGVYSMSYTRMARSLLSSAR